MRWQLRGGRGSHRDRHLLLLLLHLLCLRDHHCHWPALVTNSVAHPIKKRNAATAAKDGSPRMMPTVHVRTASTRTMTSQPAKLEPTHPLSNMAARWIVACRTINVYGTTGTKNGTKANNRTIVDFSYEILML